MTSSSLALARSLITALPPCQWACAYGSLAIPQSLTSSPQQPQPPSLIDLLVAVPDALSFHRANLSKNPRHYHSLPRVLGARAVTAINGLPAGLYYNTRVEHEGALFKYGVVQTDALLRDLELWTTFYLAGRLHKPVEVLVEDDRVARAMAVNRRAAWVAAGIVSGAAAAPEREGALSHARVFQAIAALSYEGDIRWAFGAENPEKVRSIVLGAQARFEEVYAPLLAGGAPPTGAEALELLPGPLRELLSGKERGEWAPLVRGWIASKNRKFSALQSIKGLLTAGPSTSLAYTAAKLKKGLRG
jgi:translocator assembly and maintenance protein 41